MDKQKQIEESWNKSSESKKFETLILENKIEEAKELKIDTIKKITAEKLQAEKKGILNSTSIVELLKSQNIDSSYKNRKILFTELQKE
ncbi:MAG: hypothetical protein U9Q66_01750 [Patescibacteria group bacterium]|nr:hypothetical protein [Patescibacteria group bacterium]